MTRKHKEVKTMSEQNLREAIQNYRELQRLAEDLEQEMETVKDTIKVADKKFFFIFILY